MVISLKNSRKLLKKFSILLVAVAFVGMTGCQEKAVQSDNSNAPIELSYQGSVFDAPLLIAEELGYLKHDKVPVKLKKSEEQNADGFISDERIFKQVSEGLNVQITAGLVSGCVTILVPSSSEIQSIKALKNRKIGVEAVGNGPFTLTSALLSSNGIETTKEVQWLPKSNEALLSALTTREVDAIAIWEPVGNQLDNLKEKGKVIFSSSSDKNFLHAHTKSEHFYHQFLALSKDFIKKRPEEAVFVTRAVVRATDWIASNPEKAKEILKSKYQYIDDNEFEDAFQNHMWMSGVATARGHIQLYIEQQNKHKLLKDIGNEKVFYKKIFAPILPNTTGI